MTLSITLNFPPEIERMLREQSRDLQAEVREAYAIDLFRQNKLTHAELAQVLGTDRVATDAILKRHRVVEGSPTFDDVENDLQTLRQALSKAD
jgi:predicted HTH domain antitoxin